MSKFDIKIGLKFEDKSIKMQEGKKYIYHILDGKPFDDTITLTENLIIISCERQKNIDLENFLYSEKSRGYRECVSILMYVYFKFGNFRIESFQIETQNKIHEVDGFKQKFHTNSMLKMNDKVLEELFNYKRNRVYIPLIHLMEGINSEDYKVEHSWKAFNSIYNTSNQSNADKKSYREIFRLMKENKELFESCFREAEKLVVKKRVFDTGKAIGFMNKNNAEQVKKVNGFCNIFNVTSISDKQLLEIIEKIFKKIYKKYLKDYEENKETGNYKLDKTKECINELKIIENTAENAKVEKTDYLILILDYIFYLRNKSMHGEFETPSFLFQNKRTKELVVYGNLITDLVVCLLNNDIYSIALNPIGK